MATKERTKGVPDGGNEVVEGPEFIELCPDCESKLRAMTKAKVRLSEIGGAEGMIGNVFVPVEGRVPLVLDVVDEEFTQTVGMAYLEERGA